jgi:hypothetical protein
MGQPQPAVRLLSVAFGSVPVGFLVHGTEPLNTMFIAGGRRASVTRGRRPFFAGGEEATCRRREEAFRRLMNCTSCKHGGKMSCHLIGVCVKAVVQCTFLSFATSSFQNMLLNTKSLIIGSNALSIMHPIPAHMVLSMSTLHKSAPQDSECTWHIWLGSVGFNRSQLSH